VFDEAQEFVRDLTNARGIKKDCSEKVSFAQTGKKVLDWVVVLLLKGSPTSTQMPCSNSIPTLSVYCPDLMIETW
jgi:hypothetical protein